MKRKCYSCSIEKELVEFKKKKGRSLGYDSICKECHNRQRIEYKEKQFRERFLYVYEYKRSHPCQRCGEAEPYLLDFHHRNPAEKEWNICEMMKMHSVTLDDVIREIEKCDVLCANDHRRVHLELGIKRHL